MEAQKRNKKGLKICCAVTAILLLIIFAVIVILLLTVFKLKDPVVTAEALEQRIKLDLTHLTEPNVGFLITIKNLNKGSFTFENSTNYVDFHGDTVSESPLESRRVPPLGEINMTTYGVLAVRKMISNTEFFAEFSASMLKLTSSATLPGKVGLLKIFKFRAVATTKCDINISIDETYHNVTTGIATKCVSKIKIKL